MFPLIFCCFLRSVASQMPIVNCFVLSFGRHFLCLNGCFQHFDSFPLLSTQYLPLKCDKSKSWQKLLTNYISSCVFFSCCCVVFLSLSLPPVHHFCVFFIFLFHYCFTFFYHIYCTILSSVPSAGNEKNIPKGMRVPGEICQSVTSVFSLVLSFYSPTQALTSTPRLPCGFLLEYINSASLSHSHPFFHHSLTLD